MDASKELAKKKAAYAAVNDHVHADTRVIGIGSGTTIVYCVQALKEKMERGEVKLTACVPTSFQSREMILRSGLPLGDLGVYNELEVCFDGADEIDENLNCLKGGGGCHLWEKLVGVSSRKNVYVMDSSKRVARLGEKFPIALELIPYGYETTIHRIEKKIGGKVVIRSGKGKMGHVVSDSGNILADLQDYPRDIELKELERRLNCIVGLVEHGLFVGICDVAYIASQEEVVRLERPINASSQRGCI